ncbi:MAG: sulfotransferase [Pseudomonadota bacterium]
MTKLLYIGGYGRSGTTLLETLVASAPDAVCCGEVVIAAVRQKATRCSCGKLREECPVWGSLINPQRPPGTWTHQELTLALLEHVKNAYGILVDSSKTAWGSLSAPFAFRERLGDDFALVHVVRDPRGVSWSRVAGRRRRRGRFLPYIENSPRRFAWHGRTLIGWWAANLACEWFGRRYPNQYICVRYEDLANAPEETLRSVFARLKLGPGPKLDGSKTHNNRHQLFGNRVRFQPPAPSEIRADTRWQHEMKSTDRWMISALSWPLRRRYNY